MIGDRLINSTFINNFVFFLKKKIINNFLNQHNLDAFYLVKILNRSSTCEVAGEWVVRDQTCASTTAASYTCIH
jgi:hypothetical protein